MRDLDYEGMVRDLNALLSWARQHTLSREDGQGQFSFNVSRRHLGLGRQSSYLHKILKDLDYVKRVGGNNKYPIWWIKPEGQVTLDEYTKYKTAQALAGTATQDPDNIRAQLLEARAEAERLRGELRSLRTSINRTLKQ